MKVAFGTVVYEEAWKYKDEYIQSLNEQQECEFDILIINDNVNTEKICTLHTSSKHKIQICEKPHAMSIAELRVYLLIKAKELGYDLLVLGDFDDSFDKNRIKSIINAYSEEYGFFYNRLLTEDKKNVFNILPETISDFIIILEQNFLGMSNTAINIKVINIEFIESLLQGTTNVFDWYLYTRILMEGYQGRLVKDGITFYRIHENNIAGITDTSLDTIKKELTVKSTHYSLLKELQPTFKEKYMQYKKITINNYEEYLNLQDNGYWWSKIKIG